MKKLQIEELEGVWRSEDHLIRFDLTICPDKTSFFTQIRRSNNTIIQEVQGKCRIENNNESNEVSIWFGDNLKLLIWSIDLDGGEIILELKNQRKYRFNAINKL